MVAVSAERGRPDANTCFVCGPDNPAGLQVDFALDGDVCRAEFRPGPDHAGYQDMTHGGILFSLLDDVMANWLFLQGIRAHTARCEIRFRAPVPLGTPLRLEGRLERRRGRLATLSGRAFDASSGRLLADAEAAFMIQQDAPPGAGAQADSGAVDS